MIIIHIKGREHNKFPTYSPNMPKYSCTQSTKVIVLFHRSWLHGHFRTLHRLIMQLPHLKLAVNFVVYMCLFYIESQPDTETLSKFRGIYNNSPDPYDS